MDQTNPVLFRRHTPGHGDFLAGHIKDKGGIRKQFHHVIDIVPTLLEVAGIPAPKMVDGIAQKPIEGVSMAYTFDTANANTPSTHKTQYFEMWACRPLQRRLDAERVPVRPPWELLGKTIKDPANAFKCELYNIGQDWTQNNDISATILIRCKQMTDLMFGEPANIRFLCPSRPVSLRPARTLLAGLKVFEYSGSRDRDTARHAPNLLTRPIR